MASTLIDIDEAKRRLTELVSMAMRGEEVTITEQDKPVARLVALAAPQGSRIAGLNKGEIWVSEDFDEPLPDEFWTGLK
jgi:prevent-host-death family protein